MECYTSLGCLNGVHLMPMTASARISRVRIGMRSKQSALKKRTIITAFQSQNATHSSSSSLYAILCVSPDVSALDIKSAYRRMALRYHPDVCPASDKEDCSKLFLQVQEAYETLSDPQLRQDYDWRLQNNFTVGEYEGSTDAWEGQLMELMKRRSGYNSSSWGSRMRKRNQQAQAAAC